MHLEGFVHEHLHLICKIKGVEPWDDKLNFAIKYPSMPHFELRVDWIEEEMTSW